MAPQRSSRVLALTLALALIALPAFAGGQQQAERGFLERIARAFSRLVEAVIGLPAEMEVPVEPHDDPSETEGDLGSGLDPLG